MKCLWWKSSEIFLLTCFLLTSKSNAKNETKKSGDNLKMFNQTINIHVKTSNDSNLMDDNSVGNEYTHTFSDLNHVSDDTVRDITREKEETRFHNRYVDSSEVQIVYWYYDKVSAAILGIFFGLAFEMENAKLILQQPTGPSIAIFCKFMLSPFLSYKLGIIFFTDSVRQRFDLISNGVTLLGFLSICWTVLLDGNIDLAIVMTIINIHLYLVVWPIWITIGKWILTSIDLNEEIIVKFDFDYTIRPLFISVSLFIGIFLQNVLPWTKEHAKQTLKTLSNYYLLFYFAISLFCMAGSTTMHVFYVGVFLSIVGYCAGWFMALAVDLPYRDRIAIGCESTIQNTAQFCTSIPMVGQLFVNNIRLTYTPINE